MARKTKARESESLTFSNLYTQRGIYKDGKGNEFYIYISGDEKEVNKFVAYQRRKAEKNIFGIRATVTQDDSSSNSNVVQEVQPKQKKKKQKVEFVSGKVMIGISRHKIVIKKPYKITYLIDPKIPVTGNTDQKVPAFQIELDGNTASVDCKVTKGNVTFQLWQLGNADLPTNAGPNAGPITLSDQDVKRTLSATANSGTVRWQVTAIQAVSLISSIKPQPSVFELEYTKHF